MTRLLRRIGIRGVIVAALVAGGLVIGFAGATFALSGSSGGGTAHVAAGQAMTQWPVNANGMTYGSLADSKGLEDDPDLIQAVATNGKEGYIRREEARAVDGTYADVTPENALAWNAAHEGKTFYIPVYEVDGVTVIGQFAISFAKMVDGNDLPK